MWLKLIQGGELRIALDGDTLRQVPPARPEPRVRAWTGRSNR